MNQNCRRIGKLRALRNRRVESKVKKKPENLARIQCPVTVAHLGVQNGHSLESGQLLAIGTRKARFLMDRPLKLGAPLLLLVHLSDARGARATIRFEAVVAGSSARRPFEITVHFHGRSRFVDPSTQEFLTGSTRNWLEAIHKGRRLRAN